MAGGSTRGNYDANIQSGETSAASLARLQFVAPRIDASPTLSFLANAMQVDQQDQNSLRSSISNAANMVADGISKQRALDAKDCQAAAKERVEKEAKDAKAGWASQLTKLQTEFDKNPTPELKTALKSHINMGYVVVGEGAIKELNNDLDTKYKNVAATDASGMADSITTKIDLNGGATNIAAGDKAFYAKRYVTTGLLPKFDRDPSGKISVSFAVDPDYKLPESLATRLQDTEYSANFYSAFDNRIKERYALSKEGAQASQEMFKASTQESNQNFDQTIKATNQVLEAARLGLNFKEFQVNTQDKNVKNELAAEGIAIERANFDLRQQEALRKSQKDIKSTLVGNPESYKSFITNYNTQQGDKRYQVDGDKFVDNLSTYYGKDKNSAQEFKSKVDSNRVLDTIVQIESMMEKNPKMTLLEATKSVSGGKLYVGPVNPGAFNTNSATQTPEMLYGRLAFDSMVNEQNNKAAVDRLRAARKSDLSQGGTSFSQPQTFNQSPFQFTKPVSKR